MRTVSLCSPNTRDASLMLIPSTRHALRTRKYMSTMYILVTFHQSLDRLYRKVADGMVFDRHDQAVEPPTWDIIAPPFTVSETLRGLSRQLGVSQKQARPLDADALAAIRATALNPRKARGGSLEMEDTALRRGRLDIALASVLSDAGLRISEVASLRWRDVLDAENGAGLVYIERSKTDQAGEGVNGGAIMSHVGGSTA